MIYEFKVWDEEPLASLALLRRYEKLPKVIPIYSRAKAQSRKAKNGRWINEEVDAEIGKEIAELQPADETKSKQECNEMFYAPLTDKQNHEKVTAETKVA